MAEITRAQAIEYLNSLGDAIDWGSDPEAVSYWSLDSIRAEVLRGDEYDGGGSWRDLLDHYGAEDITAERLQ